MMIRLFTGFPGAGKSFHATLIGCNVADAKFGKCWVIANFPIAKKKVGIFRKREIEPRWIFRENDELTVEFLVKVSREKGFYGHEGSALIIWDEAGIAFNSRDWNVKPDVRKDWIKFLAHHRKFGYDVIFVSQDSRMIDRQIRSLVEYEVQHKKMNNWFVFKLLPFTMFAAISFWNGLRNIRGTLQLIVYKKRIAKRYDTAALFGYEPEETTAPRAVGEGASRGPRAHGDGGASDVKPTKPVVIVPAVFDDYDYPVDKS